ncbi:hypothetical protein [Klebsiella quasipneumoniae]|uniref:hypothetical protein n=1 Tax=Klebsiella quasipneumoniae TaxID=1463165 RepID=UPI0023B18682|nr:hypothetical protein [Klebsiella quasipneumoniae]
MSAPCDFPEGMTVAELKAVLDQWPETRLDGTPTRVLIEYQPVRSISPTNWENVGETKATPDLILFNS